MPKIYKYNAKFRLPDDKYIELKDLKTKELLEELNKLLQTYYMWDKKIDRYTLYALRDQYSNKPKKRSVHSMIKKIITLEFKL